jgi:rhodanese-related sulfurtransferase
MKRVVLILGAIIVFALIPILAAANNEDELSASQFDIIADAADEYLNDPDTTFNISSFDLLSNMLSGDPYILSVRSYDDYITGHIPVAVNMSTTELFKPEDLAKLPKDKKIYVYCYTGHTGSQVAALLNISGYDATNLTWGIMGWTKDTSVATKQFSNPGTDLPTETTVNELTATYAFPIFDPASSTDETEIIQAACDAHANTSGWNIKAADLYDLLYDADPTNDPIIISVRNGEDYAKGHIKGAVNIPFKDIAKVENLQKLDPSKQIVVYCYTGRSGSQATAILNVLGYDAVNLTWGISGWTTDPDIASKRFNPDTSVDYPFETGAGEGEPSGPDGGGGGPCG